MPRCRDNYQRRQKRAKRNGRTERAARVEWIIQHWGGITLPQLRRQLAAIGRTLAILLLLSD